MSDGDTIVTLRCAFKGCVVHACAWVLIESNQDKWRMARHDMSLSWRENVSYSDRQWHIVLQGVTCMRAHEWSQIKSSEGWHDMTWNDMTWKCVIQLITTMCLSVKSNKVKLRMTSHFIKCVRVSDGDTFVTLRCVFQCVLCMLVHESYQAW